MQTRIAALAEVIALARTHVFRSGWGNREIEYAPESEANTRISKGLASIVQGVAALNGHAEVIDDEFQDAVRVAFDCLTEHRRRLLLAIMGREDLAPLPISETVRRRELEELEALGIIEKPGADLPGVAVSRTPAQGWRLTPRIERLPKAAGLLQDVKPQTADSAEDQEHPLLVSVSEG